MANLSQADKDEIIALERAYWDAMLRKDGSASAALAGDPSLVAGHDGIVRIAREAMGKMTETGEWTLISYDFQDIEVTRPAADVALIAYKVRQRMTIKGATHDIEAADASTWLRLDGQWQCHAHSEAFMTDSVAVAGPETAGDEPAPGDAAQAPGP